MNHKALFALAGFALILASMTVMAAQDGTITVTPTDSEESGVICAPQDGNFTLTISDFNAGAVLKIDINGIDINNDSGGYAVISANPGTMSSDGNITLTATGATGTATVRVQLVSLGSGGTYDINVFSTSGDGPTRHRGGQIHGLAVDGNFVDTTVYVRPAGTITYSNWTYSSTGQTAFCKETNFASISGVTLTSSDGRGNIAFNEAVDLTGTQNLDGNMTWSGDRKLTVNVPNFANKNATVTVNKAYISVSSLKILRNGNLCYASSGGGVSAPECTGVVNTGASGVKFNVATFSTYELVETTQAGVGVSIVYQNGQCMIQGTNQVVQCPAGTVAPAGSQSVTTSTGVPVGSGPDARVIVGIAVVIGIIVLGLLLSRAGGGKGGRKRR